MSGMGGTGHGYVPHPRVPTLEWYAEYFKRIRNLKGWTQTAMAKEFRCPQAHISKVESARVAPTASVLWLALSLHKEHFM